MVGILFKQQDRLGHAMYRGDQSCTCATGSTDNGASAGTARRATSSALYRCAVASKACMQRSTSFNLDTSEWG